MLRLIRGLIPEGIEPILKKRRFRFQQKGFRPYIKQMNADDLRFEFLIGDSIGKTWYEGEWFSPEIRFIRDKIIQPGDIVFDCSAHHGCMAILFGNWVCKNGKVVAFEPVPGMRILIGKNILINHLTNNYYRY